MKPNLGVYAKVHPLFKPKTPGLPNINWKQLTKFCRMKVNSFEQYGQRLDTIDGPLFYKNNNSDILAVAHLDFVMGPIHTSMLKLADDTLYFCPTLDDRAGVYAILDYLPSKGLQYDYLLTTNEEKVGSTAAYFTPPPGKKYKFIFSFDRRGTDVVMYNYYNAEYANKLKEVGWKVDFGTYSDICDLEHLRCKGFNFGVGYYEQHTTRCHLSANHFKQNMRKFIAFYNKYRHDYLPHTPMYNTFSMDEGFGYLYTNVGQTKNAFTDSDIEVLEILDKQGFDFGSKRITPDNIKGVIKDFQDSLKMRDYVESQEKARASQISINFETPTNKTIIKKLPLTGSEDNQNYNQSRKIEDAKKQEIETIEPVAITVVHAESREDISTIAEAIPDGHAMLLVDECSQCHQPSSFDLGTKTTLCKACQEANATATPKPSKLRLVAKLVLNKPGVNDASYEYVEDKEGGKGWVWATRYPVEEPVRVAA